MFPSWLLVFKVRFCCNTYVLNILLTVLLVLYHSGATYTFGQETISMLIYVNLLLKAVNLGLEGLLSARLLNQLINTVRYETLFFSAAMMFPRRKIIWECLYIKLICCQKLNLGSSRQRFDTGLTVTCHLLSRSVSSTRKSPQIFNFMVIVWVQTINKKITTTQNKNQAPTEQC